MSEERKPWGFCETPHENCTMNYCDENGCQNRARHLVEPVTVVYPNIDFKEEWEEENSRITKEIDNSLLWGGEPKPELGELRSTRKLYLYNPETGKLEGPEYDQRRIQQAFDEFAQLVLLHMDEIMSRSITDPEKYQMLRQFRRNKRNRSRFVKNYYDTLKF